MTIRQVIKIHSIDLKDGKCEICGTDIYPAILSSVIGNWGFMYTCKDCIVKTKHISRKELDETIDNMSNNMLHFNYISSEWIHDDYKSKILEDFLKIEEEDNKYVKNIDLWKAHTFKEELLKNNIIYSEEDMFEYFNFYGNNPEIVFTLRSLLMDKPKNKFIKSMYIQARTKTLTRTQIQSLKRNRSFTFLEAGQEEFWEILPEIQKAIAEGKLTDGETEKISSIIKSVLVDEFYTERQKYVIDKFIEQNIKDS